MKKLLLSLGILGASIGLTACSPQYYGNQAEPVAWYTGNIKELNQLYEEMIRLKKLHGDKCAPKSLAYAEVYLKAAKGIKFLDPEIGVYRFVRVNPDEMTMYIMKARAYLSEAREKIYSDVDNDGLPCFAEVDIGTDPYRPEYKRVNVKAIEEKLLAEEYEKLKKKFEDLEPLKMQARIHFELNKAKIKREYYPYLNLLIRYLKAHPELKIAIIGYTDDLGPKTYNDKLAYKRALAVRNYLINHGIDPKRIFIEGRGKTDYLVENNSSINRFTNRRADFFIIKTTD
jgi:outer membrane protein OmpA-like peptidoglycan-associated protein